MASEVSICNQALSWLGGNRIASLDDGTDEANVCKDNFAELRDAILENYDWTFAIDREKWPMAPNSPTFGFGKRALVPTYCLRVLNVTNSDGDTEIKWQKEGQYLLVDMDMVEVRFIRQITDVERMPPMFRQALAARLGAEIALPLVNSRSLQSDMFKLFESKLSEAVTADSMQGRSRKIRSTWLLDVR